jgi:hypothetical protein
MTSTSIYQPIVPTYLYIKQHSVTKKKYFGKTTSKDPHKYNGSGPYWVEHIKKHGKEHVSTLWVSDLYYDTSIVDVALQFSFENNIVKSKEWANRKLENGLDGGNHTEETKAKISASTKGVPKGPHSEEWKSKQSARRKGMSTGSHSAESNAKRSVTMTGKNTEPKPKFFSIIETRKTYDIQCLTRLYPEFKQYY